MNTTDTKTDSRLMPLSLAALGVVFGDIGTSPLYALRECFHGEYGIAVNHANVLGVLSLIVWALLLIVTFKYLLFIMRADYDGEGGVLALTALISPKRIAGNTSRGILISLGLFAACLLYGDGMITPAISVMSAIEGLGHIEPDFNPYVIHITIVILTSLFFIQKHGTARVGTFFGPVILIWMTAIGSLGIIQIVHTPEVLAALSPWYGISFLIKNNVHGFVVLGAVFLAVTGAEAIYADMGHFGRRPIWLTWFAVVFPCLLLNYFGQGANLLSNPKDAYHPFYAIVPHTALLPMVVLATMATIIASQAVITGAFSLTSQAIQLGYLPRLKISHTSVTHKGQIYVAPVNWLLFACTIALVLGFQSSSKLAAAYGVAVTATMLITTTLFFKVLKSRWKWPLPLAMALTLVFFVVDLAFFSANMTKIFHGAWFPLAVGILFFTIMSTWKKGREVLASKSRAMTSSLITFMEQIKDEPPTRINGNAMFLTSNHDIAPVALVLNLKHNKILHSDVFLLSIYTEDVPRVPNMEKIKIERLGSGVSLIIAHFGFMERPKINTILELCKGQGISLEMTETSFFLGREKLSISKKSQLGHWRANLFLFLSRNAMDAATFFDIPSSQVIELGVQMEL